MPGSVHFIGIGGVGVAGLAHISADLGMNVSGSDLADSPMTESLRKRGVAVEIGHGHLPEDAELVVFSAAVPENDPERLEAASRGIAQMRRGEYLNRVIAPLYRVRIAVSGSHGKSTTSAMIRFLLADYEPGYFVGASLNDMPNNGAAGEQGHRLFVSEVDESDRSQDGFPATVAVVLNIDDDHSWAIGGRAGLEESFRLLASHAERVIAWRSQETEVVVPNARFVDEPLDNVDIAGWHNRRNGAVAIEAVREALELAGLPVPSSEELEARISGFPGISRRMSLRFSEEKFVLLEDYAHHPTELTALIDALREKYSGWRLHIVFQPHRLERVVRYGDAFAEQLSRCDWCGVLEPFGAWRTDGASVDVEGCLLDKVRAPHCALNGDFAQMADAVMKSVNPEESTVLAIVGAGDVTQLCKIISRSMRDRCPCAE